MICSYKTVAVLADRYNGIQCYFIAPTCDVMIANPIIIFLSNNYNTSGFS